MIDSLLSLSMLLLITHLKRAFTSKVLVCDRLHEWFLAEVNIPDGIYRREGDFIRPNAYDWTIFLMQFVNVGGTVASQVDKEEPLRSQFGLEWSRYVAQWRTDQTIYGLFNDLERMKVSQSLSAL